MCAVKGRVEGLVMKILQGTDKGGVGENATGGEMRGSVEVWYEGEGGGIGGGNRELWHQQ